MESSHSHLYRYRPGPPDGFNAFKHLLREIWIYRFLILQLLKRDLIFANRRGILKYLWIFISPAVGSISWILMNYAGVLNPGANSVPYPLYVMTGMNIWAFFVSTILMTSSTLTGNAGLVGKIKFPHEIFFVKQALHQVLLFLISFSFNLLILAVGGVKLGLGLVLFPFAILPLFILACGIGLFASLVSVVLSDFMNLLATLLSFLVYITPVLYSTIDNKLLEKIVFLNPLSYLVSVPRDLLIYNKFNFSEGLVYSVFLAVGVFYFSCLAFYRGKGRLLEKL